LDDREAYEASLVENIQRRTLDLLEEAEALKRYVDEYGYGGISELARRIGKSPSYVSRRITFLKLPRTVKDELLRRRKSPSVAQELLSLDEEDREAVSRLIIEEKVTQREVRRIVSQVRTRGQGHENEGTDGEADFVDLQRYYSMDDHRTSSLEKALGKSIVALKLCMDRLDDIYQHIDEKEWVVREVIQLQRKSVHSQVDQLMNLRTKTMHRPPPLA
jgi:ParB family chromosome partitioning protein